MPLLPAPDITIRPTYRQSAPGAGNAPHAEGAAKDSPRGIVVAQNAPTPRVSTTSLDALETTASTVCFLRCDNGERRTKVIAETLRRMSVYCKQMRIAERILACCEHIYVGRDDAGPCLIVEQCHNRACPECARIKAKKHQHHITERLKTWRSPKLITLTLAPRNEPLRDTITRIIRAFNRLRQRAVWKQLVSGGIYVVEITRHPKREHWHVHIHALIDAKFLDQRWLSEQWHSITGDSYIVDIRRADQGAPKYISKYVQKHSEQALEEWEMWPFYEELRGKRLIGAFGNEPAINDDGEPEHGPKERLAKLSDVIAWARAGDEESLVILEQLVGRYPWLLPDHGDP